MTLFETNIFLAFKFVLNNKVKSAELLNIFYFPIFKRFLEENDATTAKLEFQIMAQVTSFRSTFMNSFNCF